MKKSITLKLLPYLIPVLALVTVTACHKDHKIIIPQGKYDNGFLIFNEGYFDHGSGTVTYFDYQTSILTDSVFIKENTGKDLGPTNTTLEFGTVYNGQLYLLTKAKGPLVVANPLTLKETARIASAPTNDWRAFVGIDNTKGLVSTGSNGIYPINLSSLTLGASLAGVSGQVGDMVKAGNYIFALSETDGLIILNVSDYSVVKKIAGLTVGFAKTPDGSIWAAGGTSLVKINSTSLAVTTVTLPFTVNDSWGAWHPGSITASTKENSIFIAKNDIYSGANTIYKYTDGNAASLTSPFITTATGKITYGAGIAYNAFTNQLVVTTIEAGYGTHDSVNDLDFYDPTTGALIKDIGYNGFFYPATPVFNQSN